MNLELASYLSLVGSGLALAAFFGITVIGILFVRVLDGIEGYCMRVAVQWDKAKAVAPAVHYSADRALRISPIARAYAALGSDSEA